MQRILAGRGRTLPPGEAPTVRARGRAGETDNTPHGDGNGTVHRSVVRASGDSTTKTATKASKHQKTAEDDGHGVEGVAEKQHKALQERDFEKQEGHAKEEEVASQAPPRWRTRVLTPPYPQRQHHEQEGSAGRLYERHDEYYIAAF